MNWVKSTGLLGKCCILHKGLLTYSQPKWDPPPYLCLSPRRTFSVHSLRGRATSEWSKSFFTGWLQTGWRKLQGTVSTLGIEGAGRTPRIHDHSFYCVWLWFKVKYLPIDCKAGTFFSKQLHTTSGSSFPELLAPEREPSLRGSLSPCP